MKNLKFLLAAALVTISGLALAEMITPTYNPASVYNPATGQYEDGCGAATFIAYSAYGSSSEYPFGAMLNGDSFWLYTTSSSHLISCSGGTLYASGEAYQGYVRN